jgi:hypothetical protein
MLKRLLWIFIDASILATALYLEWNQNKYVANLFVLGKTYAAVEFTALMAMCGGLSSKVPTQTNVNYAVNLTKTDRPLIHRFLSSFRKWQALVISITCFVLGQWLVFFCYGGIFVMTFVCHGLAKDFMKLVNFDRRTGKTVIDIN